MSTSPMLEWTIYIAGQKWKERGRDKVVGLAIFDVKKLQQKLFCEGLKHWMYRKWI